MTVSDSRKIEETFDGDLSEFQEINEAEKTYPLKKNKISVSRSVYTQHEFDSNHGGKYVEKPIKKIITDKFKKYKYKYANFGAAKKYFYSKLPFIQIMKNYKWKSWFILDIIAGIIVGTMQIPQSFAYAQLVGIKPIYGLYVAFFPVMIYYFLGTSRHISIGTDSMVSLLAGNFLEQSLIDFPLVKNSSNGLMTNEIMKVGRVAGFSFCVGISQLVMGLFNLGFMTKYLSDPLLSGFTVGSAIIVISTQLKYIFGVNIPKYNGILSVWKTAISVCYQLPHINIPSFILTVICITILAVTKYIINPIIVEKIHVPIPIELLMVAAGTISSKYLNLQSHYNVSVVGSIAKGIPSPALPAISHLSNYISNIVVTSIISYSISISLAKMFGKKHGYKVDATQEFMASGIMNIFSSFFYCYPATASVSRSAVQEAAGGKTQITSLISVFLLLFVLLFIGPFFEQLPNCILASIILVALKGLLMKFFELKELWLFSIWDFSVWVITFLGTVVLGVEYGLIAGIIASVVTIVLRTQSPNSHILGQIFGTDLYKNVSVYEDCHEIPGIKIFRYEGSLYYACRDHFKKSLYTKVAYNPVIIRLRILKLQKKIRKIEKSLESNEDIEKFNEKEIIQKELLSLLNPDIHHIIIDCSTWGYIDIVGVKVLHQVIEEYQKVNISVLLANPKTDVRKMFYRIETSELIHDENIFVSVHDSVISSLCDQKLIPE